jgi:tetratricopeptide (TPR) repeat protein
MAYALSDDPTTKYDAGGDLLDMLPTNKLYVDADSAMVLKNKVLKPEDMVRFTPRISWDLGSRNYIMKNDIMVLDLVANNNWERPIYFAVTTGDDAYVGLKSYFQLEGLAYRFVPIKQTAMEEAQGGRVNTEAMYDNVMNKFRWGGMDQPGVNLDENCLRMAGNLRMQMSVLASALINEGQNDKARKVLDKCLTMMPDETVPFDATIYSVCGAYYELKEFDKANALAKKLFDMYEGDLRIYTSMKPNRRAAYQRDIGGGACTHRRASGALTAGN